MSMLERAIEVAARAHAGQSAPDGNPYILHPLRMMLELQSPDERIAAVLHDVVEKSEDWTFERLKSEGFPATVLDAVEALTKRPGENFHDQVKRANQDKIARVVKRRDIEDHIRHFPAGENTRKYPFALMILNNGPG
jgi:(p)ppGpp synthase/HD superfamily hydrolase